MAIELHGKYLHETPCEETSEHGGNDDEERVSDGIALALREVDEPLGAHKESVWLGDVQIDFLARGQT